MHGKINIKTKGNHHTIKKNKKEPHQNIKKYLRFINSNYFILLLFHPLLQFLSDYKPLKLIIKALPIVSVVTGH